MVNRRKLIKQGKQRILEAEGRKNKEQLAYIRHKQQNQDDNRGQTLFNNDLSTIQRDGEPLDIDLGNQEGSESDGDQGELENIAIGPDFFTKYNVEI